MPIKECHVDRLLFYKNIHLANKNGACRVECESGQKQKKVSCFVLLGFSLWKVIGIIGAVGVDLSSMDEWTTHNQKIKPLPIYILPLSHCNSAP